MTSVAGSHFTDVSDNQYIFMLSEEKVYDGQTLQEETVGVQWPNAPDFKNDALWAFGSPAASSLYVWSVGTHPMCLQYADTLIELAASGFWVLCPAISHDFSIAEWVLKSVVAVDWALAKGKFSKIMLGGHSGGGPVALSSGYILSQRKVAEVSGFVLQHPGAVSFVNVPGCASHTNNAENKAYCDQFFPANMLGSLKGPILITCGTFCQVTKAENSNFFNSFSCSKADSSGACQSQSGAVTCKEGYCANEPWLENPSDCMTDTACEDVFDTFVRTKPPIAPPLGGGTLYTHCGEHEFSVMGPYGWQQEGVPAVQPFLQAVATGNEAKMAMVRSRDGVEETCWMQKSGADSSLELVSMQEATMKYMSQEDHSPWISSTSKVQVSIV